MTKGQMHLQESWDGGGGLGERGTISWETQPRGSATLRMGSLQGSHGRQYILEEEPLLILSANTTRLLRPGRPGHSGGSAALVSLTRLPLILSARSYRNTLTPISAPILFPRCSQCSLKSSAATALCSLYSLTKKERKRGSLRLGLSSFLKN